LIITNPTHSPTSRNPSASHGNRSNFWFCHKAAAITYTFSRRDSSYLRNDWFVPTFSSCFCSSASFETPYNPIPNRPYRTVNLENYWFWCAANGFTTTTSLTNFSNNELKYLQNHVFKIITVMGQNFFIWTVVFPFYQFP
jgi:hypothetical protein